LVSIAQIGRYIKFVVKPSSDGQFSRLGRRNKHTKGHCHDVQPDALGIAQSRRCLRTGLSSARSLNVRAVLVRDADRG
jgi:hypothetical protein